MLKSSFRAGIILKAGKAVKSIHAKVQIFLGIYTLLLLGLIFGSFWAFSYKNLFTITQKNLSRQSSLFESAFTKELNLAVAELKSLKSETQVFFQNGVLSTEGIAFINKQMTSEPYKYTDLLILNLKSKETIIFKPLLELGVIYPRHERVSFEDYPSHHVDLKSMTSSLISSISEVNSIRDSDHIQINQITVLLGEQGSLLFRSSIRLDYLFQQAKDRIDPGTNTIYSIADEHGTIIYSDKLSLLGKQVDQSIPKFMSQSWLNSQVFRQNQSFYAAHPFQGKKLCLILKKDLSPELMNLRSGVKTALIFAIILAITTLLISRLFLKQMSGSLAEISRVAKEVAKGNFTHRISISRKDELGELIQTFNDMTADLQENDRLLKQMNTELQNRINELKKTRKELSQKRRLAVMGEAISKISHEIQNKVGGVSVWAQNLEYHTAGDETAQVYISELKSALNSFTEVLINFKGFYREPVLNKTQFQSNELLGRALILLNPELKSKRVKIHCQSVPVAMFADFKQLSDALLNIMLNALYYSPENDRIDVSFLKSEKQMLIQIKDHGPGFDLDQVDQIFQPFFSTKAIGSGLGLAIASNLIKAHDGTIRGYNLNSGGACIEIYLPIGEET